MNRQSQSSGDNSTQVQAAGDVIVGISEDRAREIARDTARQVIDVYADEGVRLIQERITKLDDRIIATLIREGRLEVFTDPGFQRSYRKAQEGAAVSDKDSDYDLLAALLSDRAARGEARPTRAGIERSIEIVDQVDSIALRGLTVFQAVQAVQQFRPLGPQLGDGLDTMELLFADLIDGPLPTGAEWLDHLDILDAIRIDQVSSLKPFTEYYPQRMPGYLAAGLPSEGTPWPIELNGASFMIPNLIAVHELRPTHVRLAAPVEETLRTTLGLPGDAHDSIVKQAREKLGFGVIDPELVQPFFEEVRKRSSLAEIESWWGQIPQALTVTSVGRVLARANAYRLDSRGILPPIE
ncbi:LPO_1073/Vpar_1526 family protein [Curtobacterium flaccumfaciens]|uniref:LPO_1073/Vpar_1526 family protein n=1 Tax=Curtobacterium flaccumfaciens TaxID=2035 RepID=UPI001BDF5937|nr:LPO_1073/Vpar_1526 family protein [Curtobacterium flaccumfaciens]MBT1631543.1 hypothetical protein [Curtobacterium flaccumfaciens pv. oortii]MCX2846852.1 hypothetical protein [Curtobacterium flaccumfaciens pv. oortii]